MKWALALGCSLWLCACVSLDKAPKKIVQSGPPGSSAGGGDDASMHGGAGDGGDAQGGDGSAGQGALDGDVAGAGGGAGANGEGGSAAGGPACGNGVLDLGESCDLALVAGAGACPAACASDDACAPRWLSGSGCQAHCEQGAISDAVDGDGCCPDGADLGSDRDCCAAPQQRTVAAGENERIDSASELGDVTLEPVIVDGGSLSADFSGESIGCGALDVDADAVFSFVPSADYSLDVGLEGGGFGAVYALFDTPPPRVTFLHAPHPAGCQGLRLNGRVYFVCAFDASWNQARQYCASSGLSLARIDDLAEHDALCTALTGGSHWIGLNDRDVEGSFAWADGSAPGFTAWAASNPDGGGAQDCSEMQQSDGTWNDRSCDDLLPFVCELTTTLTGDTLPDASPFTLDDVVHVIDGDARVFGVDRDPGLDACGADAGFPDGYIPLDLPHDATVEIDTTGSAFAPVIALYTRSGGFLADTTPLGCHDSAVDGAAERVDLVAGSYALLVSGHGTPGAFKIVIRDVTAAPPGHRLACAPSGTTTTLDPTAGTRYYAIIKGYDAYSLSVMPKACR